MKRIFDPEEPELMDRPQALGLVLAKDLANLRSLNRYFGSHALVRWFLEPRMRALAAAAGAGPIKILDLATGSGDIPRLLVDLGRRIGCEVAVDAIDFHPSTLEIARSLSQEYPEITWHQRDLRSPHWPEGVPRADFVMCSLALHHFEASDAVQILRSAAQLANRAVFVADLIRSPMTWLGVRLLTDLIYRDPMTVTDARMSVRAAFSRAEFRQMAKEAGWGNEGRFRYRSWIHYGRQVIWKEEANE
jgi:SAM-dependent methyltransferase